MVDFGSIYFSLCCEKYFKSTRIPKLFGVVDVTKAFLECQSVLVIISLSVITFPPCSCIFNST
jgi:hypothetical protein